MDRLTNYIGFEDDIKNAFYEIILKYNFVFSKINNGNYLLSNGKCQLNFTYDRGEVVCNIKHPMNENKITGYNVFSVFNYLFPNDEKNIMKSPYEQLIEYADILGGKINNILIGDFSWESGYLKEQETLNKLIKFIWNEIDCNDPIYIKFKTGDLSWVSDLNNYLKQRSIVLE